MPWAKHRLQTSPRTFTTLHYQNNAITDIGSGAFSNCHNLCNVVIPESVTSIGDNAFSECSSLSSITIPDGITSIGFKTFSHCAGLTHIVIPHGVTSIQGSAFASCHGLTSVIIPESVTTIATYAFSFCSQLNTVYYGGTAEDWETMVMTSYHASLMNATVYYYAPDGAPDAEGNYWRYVDGVPTPW